MTDKSKASRRRDDETELRAGVDEETEREVRKQSNEEADDVVIEQDVADAAFAPALTTPEGEAPLVKIYSDLPEYGTVLQTPNGNPEDSPIVALAQNAADFGNHYNDEFNGQGGTYVIDADTGERKRVFTPIRNDKGKITGYTPAP